MPSIVFHPIGWWLAGSFSHGWNCSINRKGADVGFEAFRFEIVKRCKEYLRKN
jgi:hypothetical protein